jgi:hypothetical protein
VPDISPILCAPDSVNYSMTSCYLIVKIIGCSPILIELATFYSFEEIKEKTKKSRGELRGLEW